MEATLLIPNFLYLGSEFNAANRELLIEHNISAIVNAAAPQTANHFIQETSCYRYHSVPSSFPLPRSFESKSCDDFCCLLLDCTNADRFAGRGRGRSAEAHRTLQPLPRYVSSLCKLQPQANA